MWRLFLILFVDSEMDRLSWEARRWRNNLRKNCENQGRKKRIVKDGSEYSEDAIVQARQVLLEIQQIEVGLYGAFWRKSPVDAFVVGLPASTAIN